MNTKIPSLIGWLGAILLLVGFALISFGLLPAQSQSYMAINIIGSVCIIINSAYKKDYPPAALNVVWAAIALIAVIKMMIQ